MYKGKKMGNGILIFYWSYWRRQVIDEARHHDWTFYATLNNLIIATGGKQESDTNRLWLRKITLAEVWEMNHKKVRLETKRSATR